MKKVCLVVSAIISLVATVFFFNMLFEAIDKIPEKEKMIIGVAFGGVTLLLIVITAIAVIILRILDKKEVNY